jgi:lipopolysaccharide/colanic/teichoic acid biosynthesis glycosyltransferase
MSTTASMPSSSLEFRAPVAQNLAAAESVHGRQVVDVRQLVKRVLDVAGALIGLILFGPIMLLIALLIRLDSRGPSLFWQVRRGRGGRPFWFLKFRTMIANAERLLSDLESQNESGNGVLFNIRRDPRVTRFGRFLRRTSLDELPQLLNVLWGDMSLVGPRPLQLRDSDRLEQIRPEGFSRRLTVRPGITGAWQVGGRSETDCLQMLRLDLDYVNQWSLKRDLGILRKTIAVVLRGHGAY